MKDKKTDRGAYDKKYNDTHKEKRRAYCHAYYVAHREECAAWTKAWNEKHREEIILRRKAWYSEHKKEIAEKAKVYRQKHKAKFRERNKISNFRNRENNHAWRRKNLYGLSQEAYYTLLGEQGGACAVCGSDDWLTRVPHIDHDHITGKVRGVVCRKCNLALGHLGDDLNTAKSMVRYLEKCK
jgi:hypothetical protein